MVTCQPSLRSGCWGKQRSNLCVFSDFGGAWNRKCIGIKIYLLLKPGLSTFTIVYKPNIYCSKIELFRKILQDGLIIHRGGWLLSCWWVFRNPASWRFSCVSSWLPGTSNGWYLHNRFSTTSIHFAVVFKFAECSPFSLVFSISSSKQKASGYLYQCSGFFALFPFRTIRRWSWAIDVYSVASKVRE